MASLRVALVEPPAANVFMRDVSLLEDFTLNHPKYAQLVLAQNLLNCGDIDVSLDLFDLKVHGEIEWAHYGQADYCGEPVDLFRVGSPFQQVEQQLLDADLVGISANFTLERAVIAQTLQFLAARTRRPLVVVGGHDATADPEFYLRRGADLCVHGEGELVLRDICRALGSGADPDVANTVSLGHRGLNWKSGHRPADYESIDFPDESLIRSRSYTESPDGPFPDGVVPRTAPLETSRGCPEACSFCDISFIVGGYRPIPLERLKAQAQALKAAGIFTLQIIDDNLLYRTLPRYGGEAGRRNLIELFDLLYAEGFAWEFFNGMQLGLFEKDGEVDGELVRSLYRSGQRGDRFVGCFRSYVPLDKVTPEEMSLLRKLKPLEVTREVVRAIAECAVPALALGLVIGSVRETSASLDETAMRAEEFRELVVNASSGRTEVFVLPLCSVPLPGTPDFRSNDAIFPPDSYPEMYNIFMSVIRNDDFTPLEMTRKRRQLQDALNPSPAS